jgi:hypothetical protein
MLSYWTKSNENAEYWPSSKIIINVISCICLHNILSKHRMTKWHLSLFDLPISTQNHTIAG